MGWASERQVIENVISTGWISTPVAWDNVPLDPPPESNWIRVNILDGDAQRITLNQRYHRFTGIVLISVFTIVGQGSNAARNNADTIAALFRDLQISGILFRSPTITNVGISGAYYQINLSVPFQRDELFS